METFWTYVVLPFAIIGTFSFVAFLLCCFEDRKQNKDEKEIRAGRLGDRVTALELERGSLILDAKSVAQKVENELGKLQKTVELLEKTAVLKENRYIKKPCTYEDPFYRRASIDRVSKEEAATQMQDQREKAIKDGFTLAEAHYDGSETWVKKDKEKK